ncbi:MAG: hypothetical protein CL424_06860 [Acidimicrobiaceae bacterium]|nr:hypothetical protein [Acidimicrobiaceae bacterium]
MTDQQMLETLYPEPNPLTDSDRASMRSELFGTPSASPLRPVSDEGRAVTTTPDAVDGLELATRTNNEGRPGTGAGRRWLTAAAAVVLIAGVAGIWAAGTRNSGEAPAPAEQPVITSSPAPEASTAPSAPASTVPTQQFSAEPAAFPVLDELPAGLSATTHVERMGDGWTSPRTEALIGRRVDGVLTDTVQLAVWPGPRDVSSMQGRTPTETVVAGESASVYDYSSSGSSPLFLVTWGTGPFFVASGEAPLAVLDQLKPDTIDATVVDDDEPPLVSIGALPGDFEVIVEPHGITGDATVFATLSIGADNYDISVHTSDRVLGMTASGRPLRSIEVNGQPGWTYLSSTPTQDIAWQVNESTYAYLKVNDGSTADEALALAEQITFVDFDTWTARYSPDIAEVPATTEAGGG